MNSGVVLAYRIWIQKSFVPGLVTETPVASAPPITMPWVPAK